MNLTSKNEKHEEEKKENVSEIMDKEVERILSQLKRRSSISKEEIIKAAKKRQDKIISQLRGIGLSDKEITQQLSGLGKLVLNRLKKEVGEEVISGMATDELYKKTRSNSRVSHFNPELKFREELVQKIEDAIYAMSGIRYKVGTAMKQYMTIEKPYHFTAKHKGETFDIILKEINPKNFYDPTVLKVIKYMGGSRYKIKVFKIKSPSGMKKHYAVIKKIPGKNIIALKVNPKPIKGLEKKYLKRLGKIIALTYVCAIPDRTSDNIIMDKIGNEIKLTTFDFAKSFDYNKYPPAKSALMALDMNVSFLKGAAKKNKDSLNEGFVEAFNAGKENKSEILKYVRPLKKGAALEIKKILKQDPEEVFDKLLRKSKFFG